jgi:hypothetical protein
MPLGGLAIQDSRGGAAPNSGEIYLPWGSENKTESASTASTGKQKKVEAWRTRVTSNSRVTCSMFTAEGTQLKASQ